MVRLVSPCNYLIMDMGDAGENLVGPASMLLVAPVDFQLHQQSWLYVSTSNTHRVLCCRPQHRATPVRSREYYSTACHLSTQFKPTPHIHHIKESCRVVNNSNSCPKPIRLKSIVLLSIMRTQVRIHKQSRSSYLPGHDPVSLSHMKHADKALPEPCLQLWPGRPTSDHFIILPTSSRPPLSPTSPSGSGVTGLL